MAFLKIFVNNIENKNQTVESYFAAIGIISCLISISKNSTKNTWSLANAMPL